MTGLRNTPCMGVRRGWRAAGSLALALGIAGTACSADDGEPRVDVRGNWLLVAARTPEGALDLLGDGLVSLSFDRVSAGGRGPCNDYGSAYEVDGDDFELTGHGIEQTLVGCEGDAGELESAYISALGDVDTVRRDGDTLVLSGQETELRFDAMPPWPRDEVVGHTWRLHRWTDTAGTAPVRPTWKRGGRPTLTLYGAGRIVAGTDCRTLEGRWLDWRGILTVTEGEWGGSCREVMLDEAMSVGSSLSEFSLALRTRSGRTELVLTEAHGDRDGVRAQLVYRG